MLTRSRQILIVIVFIIGGRRIAARHSGLDHVPRSTMLLRVATELKRKAFHSTLPLADAVRVSMVARQSAAG